MASLGSEVDDVVMVGVGVGRGGRGWDGGREEEAAVSAEKKVVLNTSRSRLVCLLNTCPTRVCTVLSFFQALTIPC